ncbi:MAG: Cof-type HAD-IIB family hydrolase [Solobacterium sp.]|nr:Cof-type HAD-IIB family hydrolase [Solobacterium sp.]
MVKAIFFDIDGTLTSFKTHEIPASAFETLRKLKENGYLLFIATGRGKDGLGVLNGFPFDGYITLNGQFCFKNDGTVLYENTISRKDLEILQVEIEKDPVPCGYVMRDTKVFNFRSQLVDDVHAITHNDNHPAGDVSRVLDEKIYQVMIFMDEEREAKLMKKLSNCTSGRWYPTFFDLSPLGGTKVRGMDVFAKEFGFTMEETMALGDGGNDEAMLKHAGTACVMANASDALKAIADYVTEDADHDGIQKAFAHYNMI